MRYGIDALIIANGKDMKGLPVFIRGCIHDY